MGHRGPRRPQRSYGFGDRVSSLAVSALGRTAQFWNIYYNSYGVRLPARNSGFAQ